MKLWIKFLLGIFAGVLAAIVLPSNSPLVNAFYANAFEFVVRFGRYLLLPMLFFGVTSAVFKLRSSKSLLSSSLWTICVILISTFLFTLIGVLTALLIPLPPIPIPVEKVSGVTVLPIKEMIMGIFPYDGFSAILDGAYLFPAFIFAGFAGAGSVTDQVASKPFITFVESTSKLCYSIVTVFTDFLSVGMIAIVAFWMSNSLAVLKTGIFTPMILLLLLNFVLLVFLIYPLVLRFFCNDKRPFRVIYASICPVLVSFFSGDENLSLIINMRHGKESLGIHHRAKSFSYTLFSIFGRSGCALVLAVSFIVILRSYSKLGLTFGDILWVSGTSFTISFLLGAIPQGGTFIALTVLCGIYGRGFDAGYLLLKSFSPVLCSFACALNTISAMYGNYIIAVKTKQIEHMEIKHYI